MLDFKYTLNDKRRLWTVNMYPVLRDLIHVVNKIPWDSYSYKGDAVVSYEKSENEEDDEEGNRVLDIEKTFKVESAPMKYTFFGGICYELLSDTYKNVELSWFVDPTGDIDVSVFTPIIEKNNDILESARDIMEKSYPDDFIIPDIKFFVGAKKTLNPYYKHAISWIHEHIKKGVENMDFYGKIPDLVDFDIDEYADISLENKKEELGFICTKITGGGYLVSYVETPVTEPISVAKTQLVFKVKKGEAEIIDHVMEIVFTKTETSVPGTEVFVEKAVNAIELNRSSETYKIHKISDLMSGTLDAYAERRQFLDKGDRKTYYHKALNHVGRAIYLFDLIKHNMKDLIIKTELREIITTFFYGIRKLYLPEYKKIVAKMNKEIATAGQSALEIKKKKEINSKMAYAEVARTFSLKFYKLNVDGEFAQSTEIVEIRVVDFLIAYLDVFKEYKIQLDIFNDLVVNSSLREMEEKYEGIMNILKSNAARPFLQNVVGEIKKQPKLKHSVVLTPESPVFDSVTKEKTPVFDTLTPPVSLATIKEKTPVFDTLIPSSSLATIKEKPPSVDVMPKEPAPKQKRCPNGTRRNKKTGNCDPIIKTSPQPNNLLLALNPITVQENPKQKRCPNGTRRNKKTGNCDPVLK